LEAFSKTCKLKNKQTNNKVDNIAQNVVFPKWLFVLELLIHLDWLRLTGILAINLSPFRGLISIFE
jgi:hypothetical protein